MSDEEYNNDFDKQKESITANLSVKPHELFSEEMDSHLEDNFFSEAFGLNKDIYLYY